MKLRLGRDRRYSPERPWEKLSDDEWAVLSPFLFRAAEAESDRREAEFAAAQHPNAAALPPRRPAGRPIRDPRARLDAIFWLAAHTLPGRAPPPWAALPARFGKPDTVSRQFRRWAKAGPLDQAPPGPGRPRPPRHHHPPPPGELDLPRLSPRLAPARRARHGARPAPGLPFGAARPLLAAARPRFVRTGLFQAPRRHAPCPPARPPRPPEGLPAQLQEAAGHRRRPTIHPALPGAAMNDAPASHRTAPKPTTTRKHPRRRAAAAASLAAPRPARARRAVAARPRLRRRPAWWSLPRDEAMPRLPGLSAPVEIALDAHGIPRIAAATEAGRRRGARLAACARPACSRWR